MLSSETFKKDWTKRNIEVIESGTERIPTDTKSLTEEERKDVDKLLDKIEEDDDVINVYHTMSEEV